MLHDNCIDKIINASLSIKEKQYLDTKSIQDKYNYTEVMLNDSNICLKRYIYSFFVLTSKFIKMNMLIKS